jgi:hypothetical protein
MWFTHSFSQHSLLRYGHWPSGDVTVLLSAPGALRTSQLLHNVTDDGSFE